MYPTDVETEAWRISVTGRKPQSQTETGARSLLPRPAWAPWPAARGETARLPSVGTEVSAQPRTTALSRAHSHSQAVIHLRAEHWPRDGGRAALHLTFNILICTACAPECEALANHPIVSERCPKLLKGSSMFIDGSVQSFDGRIALPHHVKLHLHTMAWKSPEESGPHLPLHCSLPPISSHILLPAATNTPKPLLKSTPGPLHMLFPLPERLWLQTSRDLLSNQSGHSPECLLWKDFL